VHEYAAERLDPAGADEARRRLRAWVVRLATEGAAAGLHTAAEAGLTALLLAEYGNIRAAVTAALVADEPDDVGWIVGALYPFLISSGNPAEAREWAEGALVARDGMSPRPLAEALVGASEIARFTGDLDRATELKLELVDYDGELLRPRWRAANLADLCEIALDRGDLPRAKAYLARSEEAGGGPRLFLCHSEIALREGDLETAEANARSALAAYDEGAFNHACSLEQLGEIARRGGDDVRAAELFRAGVRAFARINDGGGLADCFEGLARLAASAGDLDRAGRLEGAARRLRETRRRPAIRPGEPIPGVIEQARDAGRALDLDEAIAYALG
jgi:hypothetical protein